MRELIFRLVVLLACAVILRAEWQIDRRVGQVFGHRFWFRWLRYLFWGLAVAAKIPLLLVLLLPRDAVDVAYNGPWELWYFAVLAWSYSMLLFGLVELVWLGVLRLIGLWRRAGTSGQSSGRAEDPAGEGSSEDLTRRDFLRAGMGMLPLGAHVSLFGGMLAGSREILLTEIPIPIRELPEDLRGFRIVQVSDLHIGPLIHENYLRVCSDLIRQARGNLLVVTGDIVDTSNSYLPVAGRFFRGLGRYVSGMLGVLGNHDYIHDGPELARRLPASGLEILRNQNVLIRRGTGALELLGLDYPSPLVGPAHLRRRVAQGYFARTLARSDGDAPRVLLNHHPSDFEFLRNAELDLVLSGHTHGGQIELSSDPAVRRSPVSWLFPYYRGLYDEQGTKLYVNSGTGHWLPLRINAPPEITVFTLDRA